MIGERRMAAAALLISVFVAGVVGGAALWSLAGSRAPNPAWDMGLPFQRPGSRGPWGGPWPDSLMGHRGLAPMVFNERLSRELELSAEQSRKISEILQARQASASAILEEMGPRLRAHLDSMQAEVRGVLTASQRERFNRYLEREQELLRRRSEGRIPPPQGLPWPALPPPAPEGGS